MLSEKRIRAIWDSMGVEAYPREGRVDLPAAYVVRFARLVAAAELANLTRDADIDRIVRAMLRDRARKNKEAADAR